MCRRDLTIAGEEKWIYGKFEQAYKTFCIEKRREGEEVNELDFYKSRIEELKQLEKDIIILEEQNNIKFHGILSSIYDVKKLAKKLLI